MNAVEVAPRKRTADVDGMPSRVVVPLSVGGLADLAGHLRAQAIAVPLGSLPGHPSGLGHLAAGLLRESPCPVLAVRATGCTAQRGVEQ